MALDFDKEAMRRKFHELGRKREEIVANAAPLRAKRDELYRQIEALKAQMKPLEAEYRAAEAPLYEIDQDRATLARILGRQTGKPEDYA